MIIYFCDRELNILGHASTELPEGIRISQDKTTEDVESGVNSFECILTWDGDTRTELEQGIVAGNYILKQSDTKYDSLYQIVETESDTKEQEISLYAEDAGLDLLNTLCPAVTLENYSIEQMLDYFMPSDWTIELWDVPTSTKTYMWEGESTCTERIRSVVGLWDCELYYSFSINGLQVEEKVLNVVQKRGLQEAVPQLRLNYDIDKIVTKTSIADLVTALNVTGGTPEDSETPINLVGYTYNYTDPATGDLYQVDTATGQMRNVTAMDRWSSAIDEDGLWVGSYTFDTTDKAILAGQARAELQKRCYPAVNYEVDFATLPEDAKIGDRVNIIDDDGGLYLEARLLQIETCEAEDTKTATIGEYLLKSSGISDRVAQLASDLANQRATDVAIQNQMQVITDTVDAMFTLEVDSDVVLEQATLTARLLKGNKDVKTDYDPNWFKWILRSEKGERLLGRGYTLTVDMGIIGYASTILCRFIRPQLYDLTDHNLVAITDQNLDPIQVSFAGIYNQPVVTRRSLKSKKNALRTTPTVEVGDPTVSREVNLYERGTVNETVQRFWVTEEGEDAGAHITEVTKEEFEADPQGGNLLARSDGIHIRDGLTDVASFGADGVQVGKADAFHSVFDDTTLGFYDGDSKITSIENGMLHVFKNSDEICQLGADDLGIKGMFMKASDEYGDGSGTSFQGIADAYNSYSIAEAKMEANSGSYTGNAHSFAGLTANATKYASGSSFNTVSHYLWVQGATDTDEWSGIIASTNITIDSDERLKEDFEKAEDLSGLLLNIEPYVYSWKDRRTNKRHIGFKAQDVQKALSDLTNADDYALVETSPSGYLSLSYTELIPLLVAQIQKQNKRIEELERKVNDANT
jgi:phage minor structural protein